MVTFTPVPTSPKCSLSLKGTTISMIENYLQSFLLSLSGNTISKELLLLSPSSPITKISPISKTPENSLVDKQDGPFSCKTSTLNG